ncbi:CocE/NonD family hydrolase [Kiloniella laminariae]|uniref:CocE/NonD family hydrolase n=1 Tax=Kiloniella laminariae TaxID=454162 RepID=A0ABT4LEW5_9PROT|nr:CocE/NonD family hydrolase [Kiloniella laminariae]MCZ4279647.1 CocE/NonD family hydrolase [Kiloniella laminariae]
MPGHDHPEKANMAVTHLAGEVIEHDGFVEWENIWIGLKDGRRLSARVWMPRVALEEGGTVPAILEYLPYRKRDGTAPRDESNYPIFALAGYAGVRVDICGTGESDGVFDDEYSPRELADGVEVINWIAAQHWCSGKVGMMGISWGGFNALQIAALRPEALKAVISIGSTTDRYNCDIHYKNGCHLYSNLGWAGVMQCFANRPPDPALVGSHWRDKWLERLEGATPILAGWLAHQRFDDFWKRGSVGQDYAAITAPCLVISGWADAYRNAPPDAAANFTAVTKAINGPWIHKYPHFAYPHPRADFHKEALRWWDRWLKDAQNGAEDLPDYRAYISQNVRPGTWREVEEGRWVAEQSWPSPDIEQRSWYLNGDGSLGPAASGETLLSICSPQDTGTACGEIFTLKPDSEMPGDQRGDDAGSLVFETQPLEAPLEILGQVRMALDVAIDAPLGNLAVRLVDVHPDGVAQRVSFGLLNLAHRQSQEQPEPMIPGQAERVEISLDDAGYRFLPGHRIRISISTAYWPMIMPSPFHVTATIECGAGAVVTLPIRKNAAAALPGTIDETDMPKPDASVPVPQYQMNTPGKVERWVRRDLANNRSEYHVVEDTGESEQPHGLRDRHLREDCWSICPDDPLGATGRSAWTCWMSRQKTEARESEAREKEVREKEGGTSDWSIRFESVVAMTLQADSYDITIDLRAYEAEELIFERSFEHSIVRDCM